MVNDIYFTNDLLFICIEKEKMKAINNQKRAAGVNMKLLRDKKNVYEGNSAKMAELRKKRAQKQASKKKREDSELLKNTLKNAQISTASMGIYDKKATKNEKISKRPKKKNVALSMSEEKERSKRILKIIKRKDEIKNGVIDDDVMIRKNQVQNEAITARARKRVRKNK